jgi:hypothetical protein
MAKHPGGRPKYTPTEADRATVRNMAAAGIPQRNICQCLGSIGISEPTLRKHFSKEMETAPFMVIGFAMSKLFQLIQEGNLGAICFFLKCKAGFVDRQQIDTRAVDADGNDRDVNITVEYIRAPRPE